MIGMAWQACCWTDRSEDVVVCEKVLLNPFLYCPSEGIPIFGIYLSGHYNGKYFKTIRLILKSGNSGFAGCRSLLVLLMIFSIDKCGYR
jgi:hypothetical protein